MHVPVWDVEIPYYAQTQMIWKNCVKQQKEGKQSNFRRSLASKELVLNGKNRPRTSYLSLDENLNSISSIYPFH
jgi:hypothetical protein